MILCCRDVNFHLCQAENKRLKTTKDKEIARLESINKDERDRRIHLEGEVEDLQDKLRVALGKKKRSGRATVMPW